MPRILRIINRLNLGGPTFNVAYLSKYLAPEFETMIVAGAKDPTEASSKFILNQMGLEAIHLPEMKRAINPFQDYKAFRSIRRIIKDFKPDIVHTHAAKSGAIGRHAAIGAGVPIIMHTFHGHVFHSYFNPLQTKVFLQIERFLARKSDAIVAISELQKDELTNHFHVCKPEKTHVIPLGFDLQKFGENMINKRKAFRGNFQIAADEIAIGIVGRLVPVKNHKMFLESFAMARESTERKLRAFIVGDGEMMTELKERATELGIPFTSGLPPDHPAPLTFTSWIMDVDHVMAGMDIIALTSLNEGTPVSLIEAQASARPIVSTRVGGIEDAVLEGTTAHLVPVGEPKLFADQLIAVLESENLLYELPKNGVDFVLNKYHYTRLIEDMAKLYRKLLSTV